MPETKTVQEKKQQSQQVTIDRVGEILLSALADGLQEVEALGVFGSLAGGSDFSDHSDIDVSVVVREKDRAGHTDLRWWQLIKQALEPFERDVTVLVYTVAGLRAVSNRYVLRLAAEAVLIYDRADITGVFQEIFQAAQRAGLVQERVGGSLVWTLRPELAGKPLEISLT
ncbi:MAG: nucleotidyltransferase domain-containing protein [Candidatus Hodarchaeota archaeon]